MFVANTDQYAADSFRLDALDYLAGDVTPASFFESVSKVARWFTLQDSGNLRQSLSDYSEEAPKVIYMKSDSRIMRLDLNRINYIENMGDYIKIYYRGAEKPILCLCSMKYVEEKLPSDGFIRIHRSFIVRKYCISAIGKSIVTVDKKDLPIGDAYRDRVKYYVSRLAVL